jgi:cytochrome oxidase assembly protein ShyY1
MDVRFRSSIGLTAVLVGLALVFARLGLWQLERMHAKEALFLQFAEAPALTIAQARERGQRFARVQAYGRYDTRRHILLDNRIFNGQAGVHVLSPFVLEDGSSVLVNRGWLALPPDRRSLPVISTDSAPTTISGRWNTLPDKGPRVGPADQLTTDDWPQLVTYFDIGPISQALELDLPPWILQLDETEPSGFQGRDWQPAVMEPKTHGAYAVQWFALCAAVIVTWIVLGVRAGREEKQ